MMKQLNSLNERKLELGKWPDTGASLMFADFRICIFFFPPESVARSPVKGATVLRKRNQVPYCILVLYLNFDTEALSIQ